MGTLYMTEINSETPATRQEVFDAAEAIIQYLESGPHNTTNIATARRNLRRILLSEVEKAPAPQVAFDPNPKGREITQEEVDEARLNRYRSGNPMGW